MWTAQGPTDHKKKKKKSRSTAPSTGQEEISSLPAWDCGTLKLNPFMYLVQEVVQGTGEVVRLLTELAVFLEDWGSIPKTHKAAQTDL